MTRKSRASESEPAWAALTCSPSGCQTSEGPSSTAVSSKSSTGHGLKVPSVMRNARASTGSGGPQAAPQCPSLRTASPTGVTPSRRGTRNWNSTLVWTIQLAGDEVWPASDQDLCAQIPTPRVPAKAAHTTVAPDSPSPAPCAAAQAWAGRESCSLPVTQ
jgi:hypothetical protein